MLIALAGLLAFSLYSEAARFSAFAWTWPMASTYQYVAVWLILGAVCFLHLREIGVSRLLLKGAFVSALLVIGIGVQTLQRSEAFSDSGRQNTARLLMPPALRLAPLRDESVFFGDIAKLRAKLDGDRSKAMANDVGR